MEVWKKQKQLICSLQLINDLGVYTTEAEAQNVLFYIEREAKL